MAEPTSSAGGTHRDNQNMNDQGRLVDASVFSSHSYIRPQSVLRGPRRTVSLPRPAPYFFPSHIRFLTNLGGTNTTVGPHYQANHYFAGSLLAYPTRHTVEDLTQTFISQIPTNEWHRVANFINGTLSGSTSTAWRAGTIGPLSSSLPFTFHPDSMQTGMNDNASSLNSTINTQHITVRDVSNPAKMHPQHLSDPAQPLTHQGMPPDPRINDSNEDQGPTHFGSNNGAEDNAEHAEDDDHGGHGDHDDHDDEASQKDDEYGDLDEIEIDQENEQMLHDADDVLAMKNNPNVEVPTGDRAEAIRILETYIRYITKRGCLLMTGHPTIIYRTENFDWSEGPVLRKTCRGIKGSAHMTLYIIVVNAIHYLLVYDEKVCLRTLYYRVKKAFMIVVPDCACTYQMVLNIVKEVCLTNGLPRDRFNIDAESKGSFIGDVKVIVKTPNGTGTEEIIGRKDKPTPIPASDAMLKVELSGTTKRIVGLESVGILSRGNILPRLMDEGSLVTISKGFCDRNFLRFLALCTAAKSDLPTYTPTFWVGDANTKGLWIFTIVKCGSRATVFENTKLVAHDVQFVGLTAKDVVKTGEQMVMDETEVAQMKSFINSPRAPAELLPVAENILKLGKFAEAENLKEDDIFNMIVKRGKRLARKPTPYPVVDRPLRPAFTNRDVESLALLDFRVLPPAPGQAGGDMRYRFEVSGGCYTWREFVIHPDKTVTVESTRPRQQRHLSQQDIADLMSTDKTSLLILYYRGLAAMADRSPDSTYREDLANNHSVLEKIAQAFFPSEVPSDTPLPAALMAKAHRIAYCILTVQWDGLECGKFRDSCLACGKNFTLSVLTGPKNSHLIKSRSCALVVAKIHPENAREPLASDTDPHWCRISGCKKLHPFPSEDAYLAHWLTHRVKCGTCDMHFGDQTTRNAHKRICPGKKAAKPTFRTLGSPKVRTKCGGCAHQVAKLDEHLARQLGCARVVARKRPKGGKPHKASNKNPHWCHIGSCKKETPFTSAAQYAEHWMAAHRVLCPGCGVDFPNQSAVDRHQRTCRVDT